MEKLSFIAAVYIAIKNLDKQEQEQAFNDLKQLFGEENKKSSPQIYSVICLDDLPYPAYEGDICYVAEVNLPATYHNNLWVFNVPTNDYEVMEKFKSLPAESAAPSTPASPDT